MKTRKTSRILSVVLTLTLLFAALPVTASAALADYDPVAVSAINGIITNNGLSYNANDPDNWDFATWDESTPKQLVELDLGNKNLTGSLTLTGLTSLQSLLCFENQLTSLDVSNNSKLDRLDCSHNELAKLDVTGCAALGSLFCYNNFLTSLDVTSCTGLALIECSNNSITSLDVTALDKLTDLYCSYNFMTSEYDIVGFYSSNISTLVFYPQYQRIPHYVITATAGTGGSISPSGDVSVIEGGSQTFTITPDDGYYISDVLIDGVSISGVSIGPPSEYTFNNVTENHTISAQFRQDAPVVPTYTITATAGTGGNIYPLSSAGFIVNEGEDLTYYIISDTGYVISNVLVDGISVGAVNSYTFSNITADHTITAELINTTEKFKDLKDDAWYLDAVEFIVNYGLFEGVSETEFNPEGNMNRAMFVQVLMRLSDKMGIDTSGDFSHTFKDVKSGAWYEKAISWAAAKGLITGYDADIFGPDVSITREQMAVMLIRFVDYTKINLSDDADTQFSDAGKISTYAKDAVQRAAAGGLVSGVGDGRFEPLSTATRAQVAKLFGNLVANYL